MIAQLNDITISGATLTNALWAFIGLFNGVALTALVFELRKLKRR